MWKKRVLGYVARGNLKKLNTSSTNAKTKKVHACSTPNVQQCFSQDHHCPMKIVIVYGIYIWQYVFVLKSYVEN